MTRQTLAKSRIGKGSPSSVPRSNHLHNQLPSLDALADVDRRIEVITGYMGQSHDHALRVIDHALRRGEKP